MFIIFGWEKTSKAVGLDTWTHCHHCNCNTRWEAYDVSEWITFFFVRAIPILSKHYIFCSVCGDNFELDKRAYKDLRKSGNGQKVSRLRDTSQVIDDQQLSHKTETQRNYIRAMREAEGKRQRQTTREGV